MTNLRRWGIALLAVLPLLACQREQVDLVNPVSGKSGETQLTFTATMEGGADTRTVLSGTRVMWNPTESINIFYGPSESGSRFVSTNTEQALSASFSGTISAFTATTETGQALSFWAVYPYNESDSCSGSSVSSSLPSEQTGVSGNIPDNAMMMVAESPGLALSFKQVCSRLRLRISHPDICRIVFSGNAGEAVAGGAEISLDGSGNPVWTSIAGQEATEIELLPDGTHFEEGSEYYLVLYPQNFVDGVTIKYYRDELYGEINLDEALEFPRAGRNTFNSDEVTKWTPKEYQVTIPEAVDLGLSVKWASFNLGASSPEESGDYFAWGETEPYYSSLDPLTWKEGKSGYNWESYKWCMGDYNMMTKYCDNSDYGYNGFTDTKTVLDLEDDASNVILGGNWRVATDEEWTELRENCTWTWTTQNEVNGMLVTANNGNSIFLPAAGLRVDTNLILVGTCGYYWSSSLYIDEPNLVWIVNFSSGGIGRGGFSRFNGFLVRPVYDESSISVESVSLDKTELELTVGESSTLVATILPDNATYKDVSWTSSNTSVATVSSSGEVNGVGVGTATITATTIDGGKTAACDVTVISVDQPNNVIYYTSTDGNIVTPWKNAVFGANLVNNQYSEGRGVLTFDGDVTTIGNSAFYNCTRLSTIILPNSVSSFGDAAFRQCFNLKSISIPQSVTSMGWGAFLYCSSLTSIVIPDSITSIDNQVFSECSRLTSIVIPESVTSIAFRAFANCTSLLSFDLPKGITRIEYGVFYGCSSLTSIVIPEGVTEIDEMAFSECSSLTSIHIPKSVIYIGPEAFSFCPSLSSITVDDGNPKFDSRNNCNAIIETSGPFLLAGCQNTVIPESVIGIGSSAFAGSCIESIYIPENVIELGYSVFSHCPYLSSINVAEGNPTYDSRFNCNAIIETDTGKLISGCNTTIIPEAPYYGNNPNQAMHLVTSIEEGAFSGSRITSITIPESVTDIGGAAFWDCVNLSSVICKAHTPPSVADSGLFDNSNGSPLDCLIYVPAESVSLYKSAQYWIYYADRIQAIPLTFI